MDCPVARDNQIYQNLVKIQFKPRNHSLNNNTTTKKVFKASIVTLHVFYNWN